MRMDVGNGWRPTPAASRDKTIINRMMLRFRPIAPKPAADTPSTTTPASSSASKSKDLVTERPRSKRKYVRVKKMRKRKGIRTQNIGNNNDRTGEDEGKSETTAVLTLQLLPESSSCNTSFHRGSPNKGSMEKPFLMNFDNLHDIQLGPGWTDRSRRMVESWVMVEGMSDTWVDGGELGYSDTEKMKNLERDSSCPALISDALNRVQWVNPAYRKMVDPWHHDGDAAAPELVVRLSMTENVGGGVLFRAAAFACNVRVVYWWQTTANSKMQTQTMPCDVWKMEFGGLAWRLDAKAALCLGR
ncbi:PREDICTED: uncharacterized protein LOC109158085 [Ipomoea nil]|uniref:uncharacterized protein LOC109158085 n=1 Tax=Ipomoea nil TaxID=35883 RepID=UPI000900D77C|nr:PREDICTED: uncharacterized protein LOC109158085 [Ipomoea nil]